MSSIKSMTGYGRGEARRAGAIVSAEVRSVNGRYLDVNIKLPTTLYHVEPRLREIVRGSIGRGRVDVGIGMSRGSASTRSVSVDKDLAVEVAAALRGVAEALGMREEVTIDMVARQPGVLSVSDRPDATADEQQAAEVALSRALKALDQSRRAEGRALGQDLAGRAKDMASLLNQIGSRIDETRAEMFNKLKKRVAEAAKKLELDPARFEMEVAYLTTRADISEEVTRLGSHVEQMRRTLKTGGVCGRNLDFLIQECMREIGTLSAKTQSLDITRLALDVKGELEKMREQVQNIE